MQIKDLKPSVFACHPFGSVVQNCESEVIAARIMVVLSRTGNTFRSLSWKEYKKERLEDGNFRDSEKGYFDEIKYCCKSPETAITFSKTWKEAAEKALKKVSKKSKKKEG